MFNQILTAFQGFFSRSFWFGGFLPVAVVAALHLAIMEVAFPGLVPLEAWLVAGAGEKATLFTIVVAALVVLAYALTPLVPLVRGILDGRLLPNGLHDLLRKNRIPRWRTVNDKLRAAKADHGQFSWMYSNDVPGFWDAAEIGNKLKRITDPAAIDAAMHAIDEVKKEMRLTRLPKVQSAQAAAATLVGALKSNASDLLPGNVQAAASGDLARASELLIDLITEARAEAAYRLARIESRHRIDLLPTRVGDARRLAERYSEDAYGVDFDYVWTRIQMLLPKDDEGFSQRLSDAQSQVSFSVFALVLTLTVPLAWLPVLLVTASTPWLFLAIGVLSPMVLLFFYELVVQSQSVFGGVVRAAIDKFRLQVLTEIMRQPLPATLAAERYLWARLRQASEPGNRVDLSFSHTAAKPEP
jgi:hypothetical protein